MHGLPDELLLDDDELDELLDDDELLLLDELDELELLLLLELLELLDGAGQGIAVTVIELG